MTRGLTHVGACWTVQRDRMSSFGSRRRRFSGSSSMCLASRATHRGESRDTDTPWWPWAATYSYLEGSDQVRRHAALAGHRLGACQISHRRLLRTLLLCVRGRTGVPCLASTGPLSMLCTSPRSMLCTSPRIGSPCDSRPDTRGCMLDRAGYSNELFRFSTTALQWELLDASRVSGSPPSGRDNHAMVVVGSDLFVFGGSTGSGEEARCACWPPSGVMSDIAPTIAPRAAAVRAVVWCRAGVL